MRYLIFIFLFGCSLSAQNPNKDLKDDIEFEQLIKKAETSAKESVIAQTKADEEQKRIVTETINKIVTLKIELNDVKTKLDSIDNDSGSLFLLLPISNHKED